MFMLTSGVEVPDLCHYIITWLEYLKPDFNNVNEIIIWMFITYDRKNDIYRVNIRSKGPKINTIASKYNGGGHKLASGVRTSNKEDIDSLIDDPRNQLYKNYVENIRKKVKYNGSS